jgi:hypothetical protein
VLREAERDRRSAPTKGVHRGLVCAACGHDITDDANRIDMAGTHEHTFVNPAGHDFRIGCFAAAPGCVPAGAEEDAFSWFPGWSWQIALCGRCYSHLGWTYRNADQRFWGLILAALRPADR